MKKKYIIVLIVLLAMYAIWNIWEYNCWKSFDAVAKLREYSSIIDVSINDYYVENKADKKLSSKEEYEALINFFSERKYKRYTRRIASTECTSQKSKSLFAFILYKVNGTKYEERIILAKSDTILIDRKLYIMDTPISNEELKC